MPERRPSTPIGRFRKNIARQEIQLVKNPPTIGPAVGPIIAGIVIQFIAETSSERGKLRNRISLPTGVIIAPPKPWITRIASSTGRFGASPHNADPVVNIAIAEQKTIRAPSRSAIQPLTGMKTARLNR